MDNPNTPPPEGIATLSVEQINDLERRLRENKAAQLRGEPPPHTVTLDEMRAALNGIRASRGTLDLAGTRKASGNGSKAKAVITEIDLGDL